MKKTSKILLAIATVWPFAYMFIFFSVMSSAFPTVRPDGRVDVRAIENVFKAILPLHLLTILLVIGLTIFYMVNVFRNDRVHKDKKALWAAVLFLGNVIAFPVYWYYYIWPERDGSPTATGERKSLHDAETTEWVNDATNEGRREYVPPTQPPDWR